MYFFRQTSEFAAIDNDNQIYFYKSKDPNEFLAV